MKLKNSALQELYDTILGGGTVTFTVDEESPIDKAFKECDEKLQKDIDIWKCGNEILASANTDLASNKRKLEKELTDAKIQTKFLKASNDDWRRRANNAEKARDNIRAELEVKVKRMDEITKERDSYHDLYTELRKDYDKLFEESKQISELRRENAAMHELIDNKNEELEATLKDYDKLSKENRGLNARTDCLRLEAERYRKHYKEKSDKIGELKKQLDELTSQYQKLTIENKRLQNNVRSGYDQGQTDLWVKLQDVKDMQPNEFDVECECLGDVIDMDLEDFLDVYKKWWEQKEIDRMRKWLTDFCYERDCKGCPLESKEYKCGCGYSFTGAKPIPDEDIERYYEKARACSKPLSHWECTLEGTVEIDKDLLKKVCGIDFG